MICVKREPDTARALTHEAGARLRRAAAHRHIRFVGRR
ncbi:hypothetical protein BURPS1106B_2562 [Burkholderia pseudomallei 1106b]|uniref:Uncharacterized protein n=2 Tax=Burkholderia pseudomallei TaxID=28450 RepID=A0A0E1W1G2_BURPE|nr:hypothetical protein BURPS1106A_A2613 [Burkholderia pseudomallei 1106a]EBA50572.1 hypothetical protein BURPS305_6160 [Burkholderia pseudomallei 305]EEC34529.1 conserved hypothetical protein [Burkholderia pseudomallei 576]EEH28305.1 conserved hypothetical protein [Burkholderia pseudomallei Pakistan 9]EES20841.1 hypothetical protein BURPS1106B_2562 [Burkholderia pseudomallei 1106b]EET03487.1 hypothetical protein BURPS1710A_A1888 [Burkholderia pseudomallei 1710a]